MSIAIPSTDVLLEAVIEYLERELLPSLDGYHRFQTRVAANALKIVAREQRLGEAHAERDAATAARLLGEEAADGPRPAALELADRLRDGTLPLEAPALVSCLREMLERQLAVDNPAWIPARRA